VVYLRVWYSRVYLRVWYSRVYLRVVCRRYTQGGVGGIPRVVKASLRTEAAPESSL